MPIISIAFALASSITHGIPANPFPREARSVIRKVHIAAKRRDFPTLRELMVAEFMWSFGGDGDADQAIDAWRSDPAAMLELFRITGERCGFEKDLQTVQCPPNAGYGYRAGFKNTDQGWRMTYFVAGD